MRRTWICLLALLIVAIVMWRLYATERQAEMRAPDTKTAAKEHRHQQYRVMPTLDQKEGPRLPETSQTVILDDGPRLPDEPHDTYLSRTRLAEHWSRCDSVINLSEAQTQAILLSMYDAQQELSGLMYGTGPEPTRDEFARAVSEILAYRSARIQAILTPEQRVLWGYTEACQIMSIFATHGALRLPGDSPKKLYPQQYRIMEWSDDSDE